MVVGMVESRHHGRDWKKTSGVLCTNASSKNSVYCVGSDGWNRTRLAESGPKNPGSVTVLMDLQTAFEKGAIDCDLQSRKLNFQTPKTLVGLVGVATGCALLLTFPDVKSKK